MDRRAFLRTAALGATTAIAGCGGRGDTTSPATDGGGGSIDADGDGYADSGDDYPNDPSRYRTIRSVSERVELAEEYRSWSFQFSSRTILTYSVRVIDGPDVDAIVLTREGFRSFEEGSEWEPYPSASILDSAIANVRIPLAPGQYVFVVDNTDRGGAKPPAGSAGRATVEVEFELSR